MAKQAPIVHGPGHLRAKTPTYPQCSHYLRTGDGHPRCILCRLNDGTLCSPDNPCQFCQSWAQSYWDKYLKSARDSADRARHRVLAKVQRVASATQARKVGPPPPLEDGEIESYSGDESDHCANFSTSSYYTELGVSGPLELSCSGAHRDPAGPSDAHRTANLRARSGAPQVGCPVRVAQANPLYSRGASGETQRQVPMEEPRERVPSQGSPGRPQPWGPLDKHSLGAPRRSLGAPKGALGAPRGALEAHGASRGAPGKPKECIPQGKPWGGKSSQGTQFSREAPGNPGREPLPEALQGGPSLGVPWTNTLWELPGGP